jgi:hypothetical protein
MYFDVKQHLRNFLIIHVVEIAEFRPEFQFRLSASYAETKIMPKVENQVENRN